MGNLLLNSLVVRQQASGAKNQKNSEHFAHYLLTILTRREPGARGAEVVVDAERQRNPRLYRPPLCLIDCQQSIYILAHVGSPSLRVYQGWGVGARFIATLSGGQVIGVGPPQITRKDGEPSHTAH